jgi:bacillithiol synthase
MNFIASEIEYAATGYFTKIVTEYLRQEPALQPFYRFPVSKAGIAEAIQQRQQFSQQREVLVSGLRQQYASIADNGIALKQVESLSQPNTFTVSTAHQPNIFTGHLYFIYKILHTIKLADYLAAEFPDKNFVPVYYMGSEDADLDELGHIFIEGDRYDWKTDQKGAVGRMLVDDGLLNLIKKFRGRLIVEPHGEDLMQLIESCYTKGVSIQDATFKLVHQLFGRYGLVVLIPDYPSYKSLMYDVFKDDLLANTSSQLVNKTVEKLSEHYKVQASPREINLFYLLENNRERIVQQGSIFKVLNTQLKFSEAEIVLELENHPERFSPNVILRGLFQELLLPNLAFIGGGGEIAYWLELKSLFEHYSIPFPVLVLRNSFMIVNDQQRKLADKLEIETSQLFLPEFELQKQIVIKHSKLQLKLDEQKQKATKLFSEIKQIAAQADKTLAAHCDALLQRLIDRIESVEQKILRAEKKTYEAEMRQLRKLKQQLFPNDSLQERVENFMIYYARYGAAFIDHVLRCSLTLEQQFTVLLEENQTERLVAKSLTVSTEETGH